MPAWCCRKWVRSMTCHCGHAEDEHGLDDEFPGSTACAEDDCDCIAFESDGEDDA